MADLSTLAKVKTHLGITDSSEDALLAQVLAEVSQVVKSYTKRGEALASSAAFTEYHSGDDTDVLFSKLRPLTSITTLAVDSDGYYGQGTSPFPSATEWVAGQDFALVNAAEAEDNAGKVVAINRLFPKGKGNIKLVGVAGYASAPADLELAVHNLVAAVRSAANAGAGGPLASETFGRYTYRLLAGTALAASADMVMARSIVGRYREIL